MKTQTTHSAKTRTKPKKKKKLKLFFHTSKKLEAINSSNTISVWMGNSGSSELAFAYRILKGKKKIKKIKGSKKRNETRKREDEFFLFTL